MIELEISFSISNYQAFERNVSMQKKVKEMSG